MAKPQRFAAAPRIEQPAMRELAQLADAFDPALDKLAAHETASSEEGVFQCGLTVEAPAPRAH
jgi:hypothetical protein